MVDLRLYVDSAGDGTINTNEDILWAAFRLADGETNALGSSVIPDDDDGAANGMIATRIPYFGDSWLHGIGSYIWQVTEIGTGAATSATFTVTQPVGSTWIAGAVQDRYSSNAIPAVRVSMQCFSPLRRAPAVWTGSDGTFRLYLPPNVPTSDVASVSAMRPGYGAEQARIPANSLSMHRFTSDLTAGANPLPTPLFLTPYHPADSLIVSGHLRDDRTNAVCGMPVRFDASDGSFYSVAVTDTNGVFDLSVPRSASGAVGMDEAMLNLRGLMAVSSYVDSVTTDVSNLDIVCPRAMALARSTVTDAENGDPIIGVNVYFHSGGDGRYASSYTVGDGTYEVGIVAAQQSGWFDARGLFEPQGYARPQSYWGQTTPASGVFTNAAFKARRGYPLSGHIYDSQTNSLTGGYVTASQHSNGEWYSFGAVDRHGFYEMLAATGLCLVAASDFPAYLSAYYTNHPIWQRDQADPVLVTTTGVAAVDFHLGQGAFIRGSVTDAMGVPIPYAWVYSQVAVEITGQPGQFEWWFGASAYTGDDGSYELTVPPDTGCRVHVQADGWLSQYYDDCYEYQSEAATVVTSRLEQAISNINFRLAQPSHIQGRVTSEGSPLAQKSVEVYYVKDIETWDWIFIGSAQTDTNGDYTLDIPPGTNFSLVIWQDGFCPRLCWSNAPYSQVSTLISVPEGETVSNIDFDLVVGFRIEGRVFDENGNPASGFPITAFFRGDGGEWNWAGDAGTGENGEYGFPVAAGRDYFVLQGQRGDYINTYFSNKVSATDAELITTNAGCTISNVDFNLIVGGRITGHVFQEDGATPIPNCHVYAEDRQTGEWMQGAWTDEDGYYSLGAVRSGIYRVRAAPSANGLEYVDVWHDGVLDANDSTPVTVTAPDEVSNIDFRLEVGGVISGFVREQADGAAPIRNCNLYAEDFESGKWSGNANTDGNGFYSLRMRPGTYRLTASPADTGLPYARELYSEAAIGSDAAPVVVAEGGNTPDIDFTLSAGVRIEGHVFSDTGDPRPDTWVDCHTLDTNGWWQWIGGDTTDTAGFYSFIVATGRQCVVRVPSPPGTHYPDLFYSNKFDWGEADFLTGDAGQTIGGIDFRLVPGMRIEGHVQDEHGAAMANVYLDCAYFTGDADYLRWFGVGMTDADGNYGVTLPTGHQYFVRVPDPGGPWYPETFFSNQFSPETANLVETSAWGTVSNVDFQITPSYWVEGFVFRSDGSTPAAGGAVEVTDEATNPYRTIGTDGAGWYGLYVPSSVPFQFRGLADDHLAEYFDNAYELTDAIPLQRPGRSTNAVNFVLYTADEDRDGDGIPDFQEDTRPDGVYDPDADSSSYAEGDTDGDGLSDHEEQVESGTSPKAVDTDRDSFSDYIEHIVLGTSGVDFEDCLKCTCVTTSNRVATITWKSVRMNHYYVERATNLWNMGTGTWIEIAGPIRATGPLTVHSETNAPPMGFYRVNVHY